MSIRDSITDNKGVFVVAVLKDGTKLSGKVDDYTERFFFLESNGAFLHAKFSEVDHVDVLTCAE